MKLEFVVGALCGFIGGCAVGGSIAYFVSESKFNKKMDEDYILRRQEERKQGEQTEKEPEKEKEEPEPKEEPIEETKYRDVSSVYKLYSDPNKNKEVQTVNYSGYSEPEKEPDKEKEMASIEKDDKPFKISEEAYHNTYIEFNKRILNYYGMSHDLIDEIDGTEVDPTETIGVENLISLKKEGLMFIRSIPNGEDYMVSYVDGTYDE